MTSYETILVVRRAGVVTVTLNRPHRLNAMNPKMWHELLDVFIGVAGNDDDRVLVVTGAGDAFCVGADLTEWDLSEQLLTSMRRLGAIAVTLYRMAKPTIAMVNGHAIGGGTNLALCCDIVVASEPATFLQGFTRLGLSPDFGGSWVLPRLVGMPTAKRLLLQQTALTAAQAVDIGLIARACPADKLAGTVETIAKELAASSPVALAETKRMLHRSLSIELEDAVEAEANAVVANANGPFFRSSVKAFRARKRDAAGGRP